jgi:hypothetical protein
MASAEAVRTDALDRKAASLATFASLVLSLTAATGGRLTRAAAHDGWLFLSYTSGLAALATAVGIAVAVLFPKEQLTLGIAFLRRFTTWSESLRSPEDVRGETMAGLIEAIARERVLNRQKTFMVRAALLLLLAGLASIAVDAAIVSQRSFFR